MIRQPVVLITGAGGEMGHGLITRLAEEGTHQIIALDMRPIEPELAERCSEVIIGNILDVGMLEQVGARYQIGGIFHLAAMLSTRGEFVPETAHDINVQGTLNLLKLAIGEARNQGADVRFIFPSSIAVYGLPDVATKAAAERVAEDEHLMPTTMYGVMTKIIEGIGYKREDVAIGNINRCRPPGNRAPTIEEAHTCRPFLLREINVIRPKVIVVLGNTALHNLLDTKVGITKMRGAFQDYFGVKVMPTFHPAYLLRDPNKKREVWEDMKMVRDYLTEQRTGIL